jgi:hypothetical protein
VDRAAGSGARLVERSQKPEVPAVGVAAAPWEILAARKVSSHIALNSVRTPLDAGDGTVPDLAEGSDA